MFQSVYKHSAEPVTGCSTNVLNRGTKRTSVETMLKTELRTIKRQNTRDWLNAWISGVKEKEESRVTHNTRTAFLQMPDAS